MTNATQNWAMPILQASDKGYYHKLSCDYNVFREVVIVVYGDLVRRSNVEDRPGKIKQIMLVAHTSLHSTSTRKLIGMSPIW